jgi:hypothetical protein
MKNSVGEITYSVLASKVPNNPTESTFITAEEIKIFIYYAGDLIIVSQFLSTLCAKVVHRFRLSLILILSIYVRTATFVLTRMMPREFMDNYCHYFSILCQKQPEIRL